MKDSRPSRLGRDRQPHLSADAERLVAAASGMAQAGSRLEEDFWQRQLSQRLERLLESGHAQTVRDALDHLHPAQPDAFGALFQSVESLVESWVIEVAGQRYEALLLAAPVVAWTRFRIPAGPITDAAAQGLLKAWQTHVLAPGVQVRAVPCLYSVDQLPTDFSDLRRLVRKLATAILPGASVAARAMPSLKSLPTTADMLADGRFLLAVAVVPQGEPMFRWQLLDAPGQADRARCAADWVGAAQPLFEALLPGCGLECVLPDAFHASLREVDQRVRPYAIKAAVHFLSNTLGVTAADISATVAPFGVQSVDEYRIGFSLGGRAEVVQGVVWPLLGPEAETDDPDPLARIRDVLREEGVLHIKVWDKLTEPDYCEDCGVPLFPNPQGDVVHAEMPEDAQPDAEHFH